LEVGGSEPPYVTRTCHAHLIPPAIRIEIAELEEEREE